MRSNSFRAMLARSTLAAAACLPLAWAAPAVAQEAKARLSFHWGVDHESAIMSTKFAAEVNRRAAGKLKVDVFPSGQLFTIRRSRPTRTTVRS